MVAKAVKERPENYESRLGCCPEVPHYLFTCYMLLAKKKSHIQGCLHGAGKDIILLTERQVTQFTAAPPHPLPQHTHTSALWNLGSVLLWSPKHTGVLLSVLFLVISLSASCQAKCFPSSCSTFKVTLWTLWTPFYREKHLGREIIS